MPDSARSPGHGSPKPPKNEKVETLPLNGAGSVVRTPNEVGAPDCTSVRRSPRVRSAYDDELPRSAGSPLPLPGTTTQLTTIVGSSPVPGRLTTVWPFAALQVSVGYRVGSRPLSGSWRNRFTAESRAASVA